MSVKSQVLEILEANRGKSFSGEFLASKLDVSRNAVWKAISALKEEGCEISSRKNVGYSLLPESNVLSAEGVRANLSKINKNLYIKAYASIDSTNAEAQRLIPDISMENLKIENSPSGFLDEDFLVLANEQTAGRGRLGRSFFSPAGSGIYMSLALHLKKPLLRSSLLTTAAAVAVSRAIEDMSGLSPKIKWVNDIFIEDKKVCGILTQGVANFETGQIEWAIIGIGINCFSPSGGFPSEIEDVASALNFENLNRNSLVARIIDELIAILSKLPNSDFMKEYKAKSMVIDRDIYVIKNPYDKSEQVPARALNITDDGGLTVRYSDGDTETLVAGEVSLKLRPNR